MIFNEITYEVVHNWRWPWNFSNIFRGL